MISMDKKYETRDGRFVRIYDIVKNENGSIRVFGSVKNNPSLGFNWQSMTWNETGVCCRNGFNKDELIEIKPKLNKKERLIEMVKSGKRILIQDEDKEVFDLSDYDEEKSLFFSKNYNNVLSFCDNFEILTPSEIKEYLSIAEELEKYE